MILGQPQLGFNPLSVVKSAARGVYSVARDPRVQRAAAAGAQAYAPGRYAQVSEYADRARGIIQPGMPIPGPMPGPMQPIPGPMPDDDGGGGAPVSAGPVQKGNMLGIAALVGAGLVVFLLLRK